MFQVYSGYRFAVRARQHGKMIAIVNIGPTRADDLAHIKVDGRCSDVLKNIEM
jgi:NAD-dependent deacetylase sirtuin 4